ncbi:thiol-disulfide oxidoreductase DCC family protein [Nocardioides sp.]|uniref:thiol-disulfide oxidoreductase DCC family protein n=1 Tax=Nocardioides sp. TaxID=35761 RepID=UPI002C30FD9C|nr:DCC1-like thiol-disulfide oxidoreductase family protein [Nocardioides sp.]HXH79672.1 DCC1-like thiol-disulfide oxidoreductase family protein [Nocardioides sp.]
MRLTVLYDDRCGMCRTFSAWLGNQAHLVEVDLVPAASAVAQRRFPALDHGRTLEEITVVSDAGEVWTGGHAWVMCLWATAAHRVLAESLARPSRLPIARGVAHLAAGMRTTSAARLSAVGGDYPEDCAGTCAPNAQG